MAVSWAVPFSRRCILLLVACLGFASLSHSFGQGVAWADDHGSDDDGDDDDAGGDAGADDDTDDGIPDAGGAGPATGVGKPTETPVRKKSDAPQNAPETPAAAPQPDSAPDEIVVTGLTETDRLRLIDQGFVVIESFPIFANGPELTRLRVPPGVSVTEARDSVRALPSGTNADFNHYYRHSEGEIPVSAAGPDPQPATCSHLNCEAQALISWPITRPPQCKVTGPLAVIDAGINPDHAGLTKAQIEVMRLAPDAEIDPSVIHGTAVLSLLVGQEQRAPGLVPEAPVLAIDVFTREGDDERADVVTLIRALDHVVQRGIRVANLSLAGPENTALTDMLRAAEAAGVLVVAAAGNGGPVAPPAWPAAHEGALAVTAVDAGGRIYRKAQRGAHVDIAAPGVDVWAAASIKGVKPRTGTSFAAPHVTAAAAILASHHPDWTPAELAAALRAMTEDAGRAGADDVFGAGILSLERLCADIGE